MTQLTSAAAAVNPWLTRTVRIESITPEVDGVSTYHLRFTDPDVQAEYCFEPGQFNMLYVPGVGEIAIGVSTRRDGGGTWDHTIRLAGQVTGALARIGVGGTLGLRGPYGSAWPLAEHRGKEVILVAGGTGLASLRAALYELLECRSQYAGVTLLYGGRSPEALLYQAEYAQWVDQGLRLETTVDRVPAGRHGDRLPVHVGVVPQLLDRLNPLDPSNSVLYCCGPEVMIRFTIRSALARGLKRSQVWVSLERNMQCAVGLCGHCQLGPELVCKDGPVFAYDQVESFLNVESL